MNALIIRGLLSFYLYYGDAFKIECPTGSGRMMNLFEVAKEIADRLARIFLRDERGRRPVYGGAEKFQSDPHWRDNILFYEYFHGDNGAGLGASHQTGWTGVVAKLIQLFGFLDPKKVLEAGRGRRRVRKERMMDRVFKVAIFVAVMLVMGIGAGLAQDPIVYPAKGQNQQQMDKDKAECYGWAKQQTGFDPMQAPKASAPPPPPQQKGGAVRGAAGGALVGAAVGSFSGEAGKGAAAGAAAGGLVGGMRQADQNKKAAAAQQQAAEQQAAEYNQKRSTYNRAYGACLEGRGYTVK